MTGRSHALPISKQAAALNISRGSVYYQPQPASAADLAIMRCMDELHLGFPFAGRRMLRDLLNAEGVEISRRHVATLMKRMGEAGQRFQQAQPDGVASAGIEAIYRRPNTSNPALGNKIYPYLLRGLKAGRPNQAWASLKLKDGIYLHPDGARLCLSLRPAGWFSQRVLSHRVPITMEAAFCVEALEEALAKHGKPGIFNTGQAASSPARLSPAF
jgi:putative transposase